MNGIFNNEISLNETAEAGPNRPDLNLLVILSASSAAAEKAFSQSVYINAAEDIFTAKEIILSNKVYSFDAIICDAALNKKSIAELTSILNSKQVINNIPLLLLSFHEKADSAALLNSLKGFDDIITGNISSADLNDKIEILKKYKLLKNKLPYKPDAAQPGFEYKGFNYTFKRTLDIVLSSLLLLLVSPILILIAIAIKLETRGPVFYISKRAGRWYRVFSFYKFRTMVANADSMIHDLKYMNEYRDNKTSFFFKLKDDPRVTRVGRILRKTSLDELPQLINVLKGDMSIVGNRPLPLYEAQTITVDKSAKRFFATAGITGLWQVKGRSNVNLTTDERIAMDIDYAEKSSFLFDLKIMLKTPKELILKSNV
ncbi:sugar transferase [Parafilimonas terrae]|uniref:Sugar transferase involved in LPS biosynthesis (Colanic, teichoic acid) n=1 Tax=Parafilimonas terrae TaxID=1465490 RepID=A0A1I5UGI3_9BACT|nr:sugar transferase [Parafilimonas terrae]SFP94394.1 Sugar transferase involved in LPS biosynthesis (colanic, teichoic acid) [Parafilimonas terrae]